MNSMDDARSLLRLRTELRSNIRDNQATLQLQYRALHKIERELEDLPEAQDVLELERD